MKTTQKIKTIEKKTSSNDFSINPALKGKYDDQPVFQYKVDRANYILKKFGIPKV